MQKELQDIIAQIQNSGIPSELQDRWAKQLKHLEKQAERTEFKLNRLGQEKQSLSAFLKESLEVIEEKKANIEQANQELLQANTRLQIAEEELRQNAEELKIINESLELKIAERIKEIERQKAIIEEKNENITSSINYALNIQKVIFPDIREIKSIFKDAFVFFKPRDIVSGDFYWFYQKEHIIILAAIDCTGHGVPGAFMSMIANEFLYQIVHEKRIYTPDRILNTLHRKIRKALKQEQTNHQDGMDMALVKINTKTRKMYFAGAKNPLIYMQEEEMHLIKGDRFPVGGGVKEEERRFALHEIDIEKPTTFYLFSDGYQDQFGGPKGKKFMTPTFRALLHKIHQQPCALQERKLKNIFEVWTKDYEQIDDILVLGLKI